MYYKLPNLRGGRVIGPNLDLNADNRDSHTYPVDGWTWFDSPLDAIREIGWEPGEELIFDGYDANNPTHLRIYGLEAFPAAVAARYAPWDPPLEHNFGVGIGLQKTKILGATDLGDISEKVYSHEGTPICRRLFTFTYTANAKNATILTLTHTPQWARNDGTWVSGPVETQEYSGDRYNTWRDSARARIFAFLKTYLPETLVALEEAADVPTGEALSGGWLAANHAAPWNIYMETGRKELITQTITADETAWLDEVVPDGVVPGLASGKTVREMILESLR